MGTSGRSAAASTKEGMPRAFPKAAISATEISPRSSAPPIISSMAVRSPAAFSSSSRVRTSTIFTPTARTAWSYTWRWLG